MFLVLVKVVVQEGSMEEKFVIILLAKESKLDIV